MIRYREITPSVSLRPFVNRFWILEHDGRDNAAQRVVPDGRAELILNCGEPFEHFQAGQWHRQPSSFLAGQLNGPLLLRPSGPAKMLGIGFHPHGAASVFDAPMHELTGRFTQLSDLSRVLAHKLNTALESPDPVEAVEVALLSSHAALRPGDHIVAEAVRRITIANGAADIADLARQLGLSTRQLERRFQAVVGLTPKLFCRIQRFNAVFGLLEQPSRAWADAAIACGYYDQAHLIRDCKDFSGTTPTALLADDADLARHFYHRSRMSHSSNTATVSSR